MKLTSKILVAMLVVVLGALLSSNIILKKEFDKVDKSDIYWNYKKVLQQPFKYLKITGGNGTRIAFEQSAKYSVRILQEWERYHNGSIKSYVSNDTLYIKFDFVPANLYEKFWIVNTTTVRIFSPYLLSVEGFNTNLEMYKLKQTSMHINMAGRSKFEVESMVPDIDSLTIFQKDSSEVVFEMSPDYKPTVASTPKTVAFKTNNGGTAYYTPPLLIQSPEAMFINSVNAELQGNTLLDIGHAQIKSLQLKIADSSSIIISGGAYKNIKIKN